MTTVRRRAANKPRKKGRRAAPAAAVAGLSAIDQLKAVKRSLEEISVALNAIDPNSLSDGDHRTWADEMDKVDLAIARVRNSLLEQIADAFEAEIPNIRAGTARLASDLAKLQQAVDIINAVSGALGVIEQIIRLGR